MIKIRVGVVLMVASLIPAAVMEHAAVASSTKGWGALSGVPQAHAPDELMKEMHAIRTRTRPSAQAPNRTVAKFGSRTAAREAARKNGWSILNEIDSKGTVVLASPGHRSSTSFARTLGARADVTWAEPDFKVAAQSQTTDWGVTAMHAPEAHITNGATGAGVIVAVVDTGVDYTHEDLATKIWSNPGEIPGNNIDDDGNGYIDDTRGWDFIGSFLVTQEDNDPMDVYGHGTHVAGIVAARDNGIGVVGVAPEATIMPVRVLDDNGYGFDSNIAKGIRYATDNGASIINMSLGTYARSALLHSAVDYAAAHGVTIVAAAGNEYFYSIPLYPAGFPSVVSVAAASEQGAHNKTWWSNWGNVDFLAPGESVLSTIPDGQYARYSGTSMASPHIAGALALIKQKHPTFSPVQLQQALASTAGDVSFSGRDEVSGSGFPNALAATGALPAIQLELSRDDRFPAVSDGTTGSAITVRLLDGAGAPLAGVAGTLATDHGVLSPDAFVTNASGLSTSTLTIDDFFGVATVTATVPGATRTVRVQVEDGRIRADSAQILKVAPPGPPPGGAPPVDDKDPSPPPPPAPGLHAGDDVQVNVYLGNHRFGDPKRASVAYALTDAGGDPVEGFTGSISASTIGFGFYGFWVAQAPVRSGLLTLPDDVADGRYTLTVTATTIATGATDTYSTPVFIGDHVTDVLVVESDFSPNTETFNYGDRTSHTDRGLRAILEGLGRKPEFLNLGDSQPTVDTLLRYSTVIWLGGWDESLPQDVIQGYLDAGGNLFVSGELYAGNDRYQPTHLHRDYLHATGLLADYFPDPLVQQIYPGSVDGAPGSLLAGKTFDINAYDLNNSGDPTAIFTDEIEITPGTGVLPLFNYPSGVNTPARAGVQVDADTYRVLYAGFGIEGISTPGSTLSLSGVLSAAIDHFNPAPSLDSIEPNVATTRGGSLLLNGGSFQPTGITKFFVGATEAEGVVLDRTTAAIAVPRHLAPGRYDVRIVNSIGGSDTLPGALRIVYAAPAIRLVAPTFASNDVARSIRVHGSEFRAGARVLVGGWRVPSHVLNATTITATIPAGFTPLGRDNVIVINPGGLRALRRNALTVRYGFTDPLSLGASGLAVRFLKQRLRAYGYYPRSAPVSDQFDVAIRRALVRFQRAHDLTASGVLGAATRRRLNDYA